MITSFVPLPGASGGAEISFITFFRLFFPENMVSMSTLFWRLITFYLPIIVGTGFLLKSPGGRQMAALDKEEMLEEEIKEDATLPHSSKDSGKPEGM